MKPKVYMTLKSARYEVYPLLVGQCLLYRTSPEQTLAAMLPDPKVREQVIKELLSEDLLERTNVMGLSFTEATWGRIRGGLPPLPECPANARRLDMSAFDTQPAVLTLVKAFQQASAVARRAKAPNDPTLFPVLRKLSQQYKPAALLQAIPKFFEEQEQATEPDTRVAAFVAWARKNIAFTHRIFTKAQMWLPKKGRKPATKI